MKIFIGDYIVLGNNKGDHPWRKLFLQLPEVINQPVTLHWGMGYSVISLIHIGVPTSVASVQVLFRIPHGCHFIVAVSLCYTENTSSMQVSWLYTFSEFFLYYLSLRYKNFVADVFTGTKLTMVKCSLDFDQLWTSLKISAYCKNKPLWWAILTTQDHHSGSKTSNFNNNNNNIPLILLLSPYHHPSLIQYIQTTTASPPPALTCPPLSPTQIHCSLISLQKREGFWVMSTKHGTKRCSETVRLDTKSISRLNEAAKRKRVAGAGIRLGGTTSLC